MLWTTQIALEKLYCAHALAATQGKGLWGAEPTTDSRDATCMGPCHSPALGTVSLT